MSEVIQLNGIVCEVVELWSLAVLHLPNPRLQFSSHLKSIKELVVLTINNVADGAGMF
jgi:hypothetical protein